MSEPNFIIDSIKLNHHCGDESPNVHRDKCAATVTFHEPGTNKEYQNIYRRRGDMFIPGGGNSSPDLKSPRVLAYLKYALEFDLHIAREFMYFFSTYWETEQQRSLVKFNADVRDFVLFGSLDSADPIKTKQREKMEQKIISQPVGYLDLALVVLESFKKLKSEGAQERINWIRKEIQNIAPQKRAAEKIESEKRAAEDEKKQCEPDGFGVASLGLHFGGGTVGSYVGPRPENPEDYGPDHKGNYGEVGAFTRLLPLPFSHPCYKKHDLNVFQGSNSALMGGATFFHQELGPHSIQGVRPFLRGQVFIMHLGGGPIYGQRSKTGQAIQGYNIHGGFSLPLLLGGGDDLGLVPDLLTLGYDGYIDPISREKGGHEYVSMFNFAAVGLLIAGGLIYWIIKVPTEGN